MLSDSNLTWMKFPTENTGLGMFWPQSLNSAAPSSDATLVIKTRAPPGEPVQSVCWFGSNVKLRKVNLIISPAGTVIVEVHSVFRGKLFGKFGLVRNPLVPARSPSPHSAAKQNTSAWPHGKKRWSLLPILFKLQFALFHNLLKERAIQRRIQDFSRTDTTKRDFFKNEQTGSFSRETKTSKSHLSITCWFSQTRYRIHPNILRWHWSQIEVRLEFELSPGFCFISKWERIIFCNNNE